MHQVVNRAPTQLALSQDHKIIIQKSNPHIERGLQKLGGDSCFSQFWAEKVKQSTKKHNYTQKLFSIGIKREKKPKTFACAQQFQIFNK